MSMRTPFLLLLLASGCGSLERPDPMEHPDVKALLGAWKASPLMKVGVHVALQPGPKVEIRHGIALAPDTLDLRRGLVDLLRKTGKFGDVTEVLPRTRKDGTPEEAAKARGMTHLVKVAPLGGRVVWLGRNWLWWPSLALWLLAWFPSWMVRDEDFGMDVMADFEVVDLGTGEAVGSFSVQGKAEAGLNDMERGFHLLGLVRAPYCLNPVDYRSAGRALAPMAWSDFHVRFLLELCRVLGKAP